MNSSDPDYMNAEKQQAAAWRAVVETLKELGFNMTKEKGRTGTQRVLNFIKRKINK